MAQKASRPENPKLSARSALGVVAVYLVSSIMASLLASIYFGGIGAASADRMIDDVIDHSIIANLVVMAILLFFSLWVFRDSRRDIFFERKPFSLSWRYYLLPLAWFGVSLFAFSQVDSAAYSWDMFVLLLLAALTIGVNEELVTRGILLVGLRNSGVREWIAWLISLAVFSMLHLVNVLGGASPMLLLITAAGGTLLYVSRRVFGNLFVPIGLHALYDTAFFLLTGKYATDVSLPGHVLGIQLGSVLLLLVAATLFLVLGRKLFRPDTVGWPSKESSAEQPWTSKRLAR